MNDVIQPRITTIHHISIEWLSVLVVLTAFSLLTIPRTWAETGEIHVAYGSGQDTDGCGSATTPCRTINYGLRQADSGDTILVAEGVYIETLAISTTVTLSGGYEARNWTRDINEYHTVINGDGQAVVIQVNDAATTVEGFTITNGETGIRLDNADTSVVARNRIRTITGAEGTQEHPSGDAIGITCSNSSLTIHGNEMSYIRGGGGHDDDGSGYDYWPDDGGNAYGIFCQEDSSLLITNNEISDVSGGGGGRAPTFIGGDGGIASGIMCLDSAVTIIANHVRDISGGNGGGGDSGGSGGSAGGISLGSCTASSLTGNQVSNVQGGRAGGGPVVGGGFGGSAGGISLGSCTASSLTSNQVSNVQGGDGGDGPFDGPFGGGWAGSAAGIEVARSPAIIANSIVALVSGGGGGSGYPSGEYSRDGGQATGILLQESPSLFAINNTIWGITGGDGPSGWNEGYEADGGRGIGIATHSSTSLLLNNVVANSSGGRGGAETAGEITGAGYGVLSTDSSVFLTSNNVWNHSTANYSGLVPGESNISVDPMLRDPGAGDFHLRPGSPLIDGGTESHITFDFEEDPRPYDGNGDGTPEFDIGADEWTAKKLYLPFIRR